MRPTQQGGRKVVKKCICLKCGPRKKEDSSEESDMSEMRLAHEGMIEESKLTEMRPAQGGCGVRGECECWS